MLDTPTKITRQDFARAINVVCQGLEPADDERELELITRIVAAATYITDQDGPTSPTMSGRIREREGIGPFLAGLTRLGRKELKQAAEGITIRRCNQ